MRPDYYNMILNITTEGEEFTVSDVIDRLLDKGYRNVPTSSSIARTLNKCPCIERFNNKPRSYRRVTQ